VQISVSSSANAVGIEVCAPICGSFFCISSLVYDNGHHITQFSTCRGTVFPIKTPSWTQSREILVSLQIVLAVEGQEWPIQVPQRSGLVLGQLLSNERTGARRLERLIQGCQGVESGFNDKQNLGRSNGFSENQEVDPHVLAIPFDVISRCGSFLFSEWYWAWHGGHQLLVVTSASVIKSCWHLGKHVQLCP